MDKNFILQENGQWSHAPTFKVVINSVLRFLQRPFTNRPIVIASLVVMQRNRPVELEGYKITRVAIYE